LARVLNSNESEWHQADSRTSDFGCKSVVRRAKARGCPNGYSAPEKLLEGLFLSPVEHRRGRRNISTFCKPAVEAHGGYFRCQNIRMSFVVSVAIASRMDSCWYS